MDQSEQSQQQQQHVNTGAGQMIPNGTFPFVPTTSLGIPVSMPTHSVAPSSSQHHLTDRQHQRMESFWANQMEEAEQASEFKNHMLPLARVKKIMKADEDVRMISSEAPVVFAKACEMFISELSLRAWMHTEDSKRKTLQKNDIAAAISKTETFDFLVDVLPRDELREESHAPSAEPVQYYYLPQQQNHQQPGFVAWPHQLHQNQNQLQNQNQNHQNQNQENNDRV